MENGFIYEIFNVLINSLKYLNIVELFKKIAIKLSSSEKHIRKNANIAIDIFIIFKFLIIILFWYKELNNIYATIITYYLILINIYTYFYYHVWSDKANNRNQSNDKNKRRFLNLIIAILYSDICYGYLYNIVYSVHFLWEQNTSRLISSLQLSIYNSFAGSFYGVKPITDLGIVLTTSQLLITFIFIAIILTRTIPPTSISDIERNKKGVKK